MGELAKIKAFSHYDHSSSPLADGGGAGARVLVMGTYTGLNFTELFHFPHFGGILARIHEAVSFIDHVLVSHRRSTSVGSHSLELHHFVENLFVLGILHLLNSGSLIFVLMAHNRLHRSRRTIRSSESILDVVNVDCRDGVLFLDGSLARASNSNLARKFTTHGVLVNASCYFVGCCDFVQSFEIFVVNLWSLKGLLFVDPLGSH